MGRVYDAIQRIDEIVAAKGLDPLRTKGEIGVKAGFILGFVGPNDPDDLAQLEALVQVCKEVLGEDCIAP